MPTINEVWEQAQQINANLVTVHNDLVGLRQREDETNAWLADLRQLVADGMSSLATGLAGIQARQDIGNQLLWVLLEQEQAVLCNLEKISEATCKLLNESVRQTGFQATLAEAVDDLRYLVATAHPDAALVLARHHEDQKRLAACCPPEKPEPPCTYRPCPAPDLPQPERPERYGGFRPKPPKVKPADDRPPG